MLMEAVVEKKQALSELLRGYKSLPQTAISVPVTDKTAAMEGVLKLAEKLERELDVRIIARPSGTERVVRVMAEGKSEEGCALACKLLCARILENCG